MSKKEAIDFDRNKINYARFSHNLKEQFDNFLDGSYEFLQISENRYTHLFKDLVGQEEVNTFLEIDMERILADCKFHVVDYKDFSACADPEKTKELILEIKTIAENNIHNLDINMKASENVQVVSDLLHKLESQEGEARDSFRAAEVNFDIGSSAGVLSEIFTRSEALLGKYYKIVEKVKQFELFFSTNEDCLQDALANFSAQRFTREDLAGIFASCMNLFKKINADCDEILSFNLSREDVRLVRLLGFKDQKPRFALF
jgi:hypothetical protein